MKRIAIASLIAFQLSVFAVSHAQAPVIEDSDNFALQEEQDDALYEQPARAQLPEDEEEMSPLAQDNTPSANDAAALSEQLQALQQEVQELRGQLEVQAHELERLQQQQLTFYKDLDKRLQASPNATPHSALNLTENKPVDRGNPADEQIRYLAAYDLLKNNRFDEATQAMQDFIAQYPQSGYTANAHYWLGDLYLAKKENEKAIQEFTILLKQFPTSSKAAPSHLKIACALIASGKKPEARERLQEILRKYPDTPTARMAIHKLEALSRS